MTEDDQLLAGFWQAMAEQGWHGLTRTRIAERAGLPLTTLRARCPDRLALLRLHAARIDAVVLDGTVGGQDASARDRVFDALMRRVDAIQPHRAGILRLVQECRSDPLLGLMLALALPRGLDWMLEAAGIAAGPGRDAMLLPGIAGVWIATMRVWVGDGTADLGPTMAALDRALDRAGQVARSLRIDLPS